MSFFKSSQTSSLKTFNNENSDSSYVNSSTNNNLSSVKRNSVGNSGFEEKEITKLLDIMNQEFLNLTKLNNFLNETTSSFETVNRKQYLVKRESVIQKLSDFKKCLLQLNQIIERIKRLLEKCFDEAFLKKSNLTISTTKDKVLKLIDFYGKYEDIIEKYDFQFEYDDVHRKSVDTSNINNNSGLTQSFINRDSEIDGLRMSLLIVTEIQSQEHFMVERQEKLQDIHK